MTFEYLYIVVKFALLHEMDFLGTSAKVID